MNKFGAAELKTWRRKVGVTQQQLAILLDIPPLTISGWETGRIPIKRPRLLELACKMLELEAAPKERPKWTVS
jgi:DNA-binding transcriptional regulator YiaG